MRRFFSITIHHLVLVVLAIAVTVPLVWMFVASLMVPGTALSSNAGDVSELLTLENYRQLFTRLSVARYFLNSLIIASGVTLSGLLFNSMAGYAFAKLRFWGRERLFTLLLAALVVPVQVTMLPLFLLLKEMGLVNSYWAVMIPNLATIYGIFLVRQFALSIPDSLLDAARIDGAGEFRLYFSIVLPCLRPVLITLGIFTFLAMWNDFMWPLIVLSDKDKYTLPVALAVLSGEYVQDVELMMAGSVITTLPVIFLFLVLQKYFLGGIMMGSVKG